MYVLIWSEMLFIFICQFSSRRRPLWTHRSDSNREEVKILYLTMHFQEEPSWSSCSSMYILTLWSWSNWYQYMRPSLSRPIGWRRIVSASSSLIMFLNLRLSSNWHSQRYWKTVTLWFKIPYKHFSNKHHALSGVVRDTARSHSSFVLHYSSSFLCRICLK